MLNEMEASYFFKPCNDLMPREHSQMLQNHFDKFSRPLEEVVNFGSQVLTWRIEHFKNEEFLNVPVMLVREAMDLTDSCSILFSRGAADTSKVLARSLFEVFLYMNFLCTKDIRIRSYAYMVSSVLDFIKYNNDVLKKYSKKSDGTDGPLNSAQIQEIRDLIAGKESLFSVPGYDEAYAFYATETARRNKTKNGRKVDKWYSYYGGPESIRALAQEVGALDAYLFFYSKYSKFAHGNEVLLGKMVANSEGSSEMVQLRSFSDLQDVFTYVFCFSTSILKKYLAAVFPDKSEELAIFRTWCNTVLERS